MAFSPRPVIYAKHPRSPYRCPLSSTAKLPQQGGAADQQTKLACEAGSGLSSDDERHPVQRFGRSLRAPAITKHGAGKRFGEDPGGSSRQRRRTNRASEAGSRPECPPKADRSACADSDCEPVARTSRRQGTMTQAERSVTAPQSIQSWPASRPTPPQKYSAAAFHEASGISSVLPPCYAHKGPLERITKYTEEPFSPYSNIASEMVKRCDAPPLRSRSEVTTDIAT